MFDFKSFTENEKEYIQSFYGNDRDCVKGGYVKIMCGNNSRGVFVPVHCLGRSDFRKYFENKRLNEKNMMMSMCSFEKKHNATKEDIVNVFALCVDVDYNFGANDNREPLAVWKQLCKDLVDKYCFFAVPTYIEYGHRLRMIYMLKDPVCLRIENRKQRKNVIKWCERITQVIADAINETDARYHAEPQQLTKFVRVPESVNVSYSQQYNPTLQKQEFHLERANYINIMKIPNGDLWDIHDLSDFVLPSQPEWYDDWKNKKEKKKAKISIRAKQNRSLNTLMEKRIDFLKTLQKEGWNHGYRELMCFLHWDFCLTKGDSAEEAKEKTLQFNRGFYTPLPEKEMLTRSLPRKMYFYGAQTLYKILDVPKEKQSLSTFNKKEYDRKYAKARRMQEKIKRFKKGITRKQKKETKITKALRLKELGASVRQIAEELKVCIRTIYKYFTTATPSLG